MNLYILRNIFIVQKNFLFYIFPNTSLQLLSKYDIFSNGISECKGLKLIINLICDIILASNKEIFYIKITNCYILHLLDLK